jgi:hypothetical protein
MPDTRDQAYGIPIRSHGEISTPCLRVLRKLLSDRGLRFKGALLTGGEGEMYLTSQSATQGVALRPYPVILLLPKEALTYWLAMALTFRRDTNLRMTSASMIVFEGVAGSATKTPLFRAEWHEWNSQSPHAQPHWHVYPSALTDFALKVPEAFSVEQPTMVDFRSAAQSPASSQITVSRAGSPLIAEFHYAMSARWHVQDGSCQERLMTTDGLLNWIKGCISYTVGQLNFVTR